MRRRSTPALKIAGEAKLRWYAATAVAAPVGVRGKPTGTPARVPAPPSWAGTGAGTLCVGAVARPTRRPKRRAMRTGAIRLRLISEPRFFAALLGARLICEPCFRDLQRS